jgi:hypothetical protein
MKLLIRRSAFQGLIYLLAAAAVVCAVKILSASTGNAYFVLLGNLLIYLMIMGMIFIGEQYEEKHKGYTLLAALPVKIREVVAVKFLLVLLSLGLYLGFLVILAKIYVSAQNFALVRSLFLLNGSAALILAGLFFIGIFGLGYTKFSIVFLSFTAALGFVPMGIRLFADLDKLIGQFKAFLRTVPWMWVLPLVLTLFAALFFLAATIKERRAA